MVGETAGEVLTDGGITDAEALGLLSWGKLGTLSALPVSVSVLELN